VPSSLDGKLLKLMQGLRQKRCLLVLDNAETILSAGQTGQYRAGYEGIWSTVQRDGGGVIRVACCSPAAKSPEKCVPPKVRNNQYEHCYWDCNPKPDENSFVTKEYLQVRNRNGISGTLSRQCLALKLVAAATQELFNGRIVEVLNCAAGVSRL